MDSDLRAQDGENDFTVRANLGSYKNFFFSPLTPICEKKVKLNIKINFTV